MACRRSAELAPVGYRWDEYRGVSLGVAELSA
jgi:hypothetical protein